MPRPYNLIQIAGDKVFNIGSHKIALYERTLKLTMMAAIYMGVCGIVLVIFFLKPGVAVNSRATFLDMVNGSAHKPFVYRTLTPFVIREISDHSPQLLKKVVCTIIYRLMPVEIERLILEDKRDRAIASKDYRYCLGALIMYLCFLGYAILLYCLLREYYSFPNYVNEIAPVFGVLFLPVFFRYHSYIYDPSTLCLYTLGLLCISKRLHVTYYFVLVLAIFNKETALLLLALYFLKEAPLVSRSRLIKHLVLQGMIFGLIRAYLWIAFKDNPGPSVEFHLDHNIFLILDPLSKTTIGLLSVVLFCGMLVGYQWKHKPEFLRKGLLVTIVPLVGLALFFGYLDELRAFYEMLPFIFLLSAPTIVKIFGIESPQDLAHSGYVISMNSKGMNEVRHLPQRKENG